jgi:hypothetical protein
MLKCIGRNTNWTDEKLKATSQNALNQKNDELCNIQGGVENTLEADWTRLQHEEKHRIEKNQALL